jgi:hypothetical protein
MLRRLWAHRYSLPTFAATSTLNLRAATYVTAQLDLFAQS